MKLIKRGKDTNIKRHNVAKSPNQTVLNAARENLLHSIIYNRHRELLNYSGVPDVDYSSSLNVNGNYDCEFYIIWPTRGLTDGKVRIGYYLTTWDNYNIKGNCLFAWDGSPSGKSDFVGTPAVSSAQSSTLSITDIKKPDGLAVSDDYELDFDHQDFGGYSYTKVSFRYLQPASFISWIMSEYETDFNKGDTDTKALNLSDSNFNIGQQVRGANSYNDTNGSVGGLCQNQFNNGTSTPNMINSSDLCLYQWGHPAGLGVVGSSGSLAWVEAPAYFIKIKGRQLKTSTSGLFDVALIYRADTTTKIRVYVLSTTTNHDYTLTSSTGTPDKKVVLTDIPFDASGDDIKISFHVSNAAFVEVKTIAIFETGD